MYMLVDRPLAMLMKINSKYKILFNGNFMCHASAFILTVSEPL